jgi:hypothetical protein
MPNRELVLNQSLIEFENLDELLVALDECIDIHAKAVQRYGDRLGALLRQGKSTTDQGGDSNQSQKQQQQQQAKENPTQKRGGGRAEKGDPWTNFRLDKEGNVNLRVANPSMISPVSAENSILFRLIETLREKLQSLETARKIIAGLPSQGCRAEQRFLVSFAEGLPRQVIPMNQTSSAQVRFQFKDDFQLDPLDEPLDDLVQP